MKLWLKKLAVCSVLVCAIFILVACTNESLIIDEMHIEQTVNTFLSGYEKNDSAQIMSVINLDDSKKAGFELILKDYLRSLHRDPYTIKINYFIDNIEVLGNTANIKMSAVLKIFENDSEFMTVRLFRDRDLYLLKNSAGEWKINFKEFIPEELLKINSLY